MLTNHYPNFLLEDKVALLHGGIARPPITTTRNQDNYDARNNVGERCVTVDHLSLTHEMLCLENSKIKFNVLTFYDAYYVVKRDFPRRRETRRHEKSKIKFNPFTFSDVTLPNVAKSEHIKLNFKLFATICHHLLLENPI